MARAFLSLARETDRAAAAAGVDATLLQWADLLRVIPDGGIEINDLAAGARISKRAAKGWLASVQRQGLIDFPGTTQRPQTITLTERGRLARDRWPETVAGPEARWSDSVGGAADLRSALVDLVGRLDLELPLYPMIYGAVDWRAIGGNAVKAKAGPPPIPAHGTDWSPVLRVDGGGARALPLFALLSQALMAFTIDYEDKTFSALSVGVLLGRAMPDGSAPLQSLPPVLMVDGAGKSSLERHGVVRVTGKGSARVAALTRVGVWLRDAYGPTVEAVTRDWHERFGAGVVNAVKQALASIDAALPDAVPDLVLVRHVSVNEGFVDVSFGHMT